YASVGQYINQVRHGALQKELRQQLRRKFECCYLKQKQCL
ncbi:MAG: hypothetical protein RLZ50_1423, partial [Bacteroidota bacterium]